jgi:hypothetical protein
MRSWQLPALSCLEMVYNKLCGSGKEENNLKLVDPAIRLLAVIHYLPVVITGQLPPVEGYGTDRDLA